MAKAALFMQCLRNYVQRLISDERQIPELRFMLRFLLVALFLAATSAFVAQGPLPQRAVRAVSPVAQFGTGNTDNNGFDEKGNANFVFSPITGGSKVRASSLALRARFNC